MSVLGSGCQTFVINSSLNVETMQNFIKRCIPVKKLVSDMNQLGVSTVQIQNISFEELIGFLRMKPTIAIAKACIHRILRLALLQSKIRPPDAADKINVRIFLAAYMIVCFPTNVFERIGPMEQALLDAARRMLETFEGICLAVHGADRPSVAQLPRPLMERLPGEVREYLDRFAAWRVPDEARLVGRIERALLAVLQARAEAGAGAAGLNAAELEGQAARLREKLAKLAGTDAVDRVEAAARASSVQLHA